MRNISEKMVTRRTAVAKALVQLSERSRPALIENAGPKKDILPTARAAAFLAVKNTFMALPHCHPIPVEACEAEFNLNGFELEILVSVTTNYKTGCEMEALHGASIAALTVYDMLKPVDNALEIKNVVLVKKTGGKSDVNRKE